MTIEAENATQISAASNAGFQSHAARVEAAQDKVRHAISLVLKANDDRATDLAREADAAVEAIDDATEETAKTSREIDRAQAEVAKKYHVDLPGIDQANLTTLREQAKKATALEIAEKAKPRLDAAAKAASDACARFAMMLDLADNVTPELDLALDGKVTPADLASEHAAVAELSPLPMQRIRKMYQSMVAAEPDEKRLLRFEKAAAKVARARLGMNTEELIAFTGGMGRDLGGRQKEDAEALLEDIDKARSRRTPTSVKIARDEVLPRLRESFRLLCMGDKSHTDATGQSSESIVAARAPWTPLPGWEARYGIGRK